MAPTPENCLLLVNPPQDVCCGCLGCTPCCSFLGTAQGQLNAQNTNCVLEGFTSRNVCVCPTIFDTTGTAFGYISVVFGVLSAIYAVSSKYFAEHAKSTTASSTSSESDAAVKSAAVTAVKSDAAVKSAAVTAVKSDAAVKSAAVTAVKSAAGKSHVKSEATAANKSASV